MPSADPHDPEHRRRLESLIERLPAKAAAVALWLLRPESRWARLPAGALLVLGGCLGFFPVLGFWMLPLGVVLIAEDVPVFRRFVARALERAERRWPGLFSRPPGDGSPG
jgi:hypothetical protein